jgi:DnaJ-class molecular chaperone
MSTKETSEFIADCWDCGGWGCKPPSDTCPTCSGNGLVRYCTTIRRFPENALANEQERK